MPGHRGLNSSARSKGDPQMDFDRTTQRALAADHASGGKGLWRKA
jgi:hypothetical protein